MSSGLPDLSTLAAKPPQRPTENLPSRPSTSNYKEALASAANKENQSTQAKPANLKLDEAVANEGQEAFVSPTSTSWRPNLDRQQSWSMQDHRRAMQSPLMSPSLEKGKEAFGFTSKDDEATKGKKEE